MDQEYTERLHKIEKELERWLPEKPDSLWAKKVFGDIGNKADPDSMNTLLAPLRELLFRGGKRWRPLLMMLFCEALGGKDASVPLAPIIEFSHNASLIHDDIEDDSDERRGKPSVHKIYGVDVAINSGSFFYFLASSCIESCDFKNKELIYKLWTECMRKLHLGQSMDIHWHRNFSLIPSIGDYFFMCSMKTGSLARLSIQLGVLAADIPELSIDNDKLFVPIMSDAVDKIGVGFQILDDVKNLRTGVPGKKRGDDIVEGKKSLPVILYLNKFPDKKEQIFRYFEAAKSKSISAPEIDEMIYTLSLEGVLDEAEKKGKSLLRQSEKFFQFDDIFRLAKDKGSYDLLCNFFKLIG